MQLEEEMRQELGLEGKGAFGHEKEEEGLY